MSQQLLRRPPKRHSVAGADSVGPQSVTVRRRYVRAGRVVLWLLLVLVAVFATIRGIVDMLGNVGGTVARVSAPAAFPDDEARAFAARFAQVFLSYSPVRPDDHAHALSGLLSGRLRADGAVQIPAHGGAQHVTQAWVARTQRLSSRRALVTVACVVARRGTTRLRYLSVPVARDRAGGLVVDDYPAFTSPPRLARPAPVTERALETDADAIEAVLTRFLTEYVHGDVVAPEFLAPGTTIAPLAQEYELEDVVSVAQEGPDRPDARRVLTVVRVRDVRTTAVYTLRYRVGVIRRDRWLINEIEG